MFSLLDVTSNNLPAGTEENHVKLSYMTDGVLDENPNERLRKTSQKHYHYTNRAIMGS
jgi:hypothetical protein